MTQSASDIIFNLFNTRPEIFISTREIDGHFKHFNIDGHMLSDEEHDLLIECRKKTSHEITITWIDDVLI